MSSATRAQQLLRWATVWPQQTWAEKWGLVCTFLGGAWFPSNTMWPGSRPTSVRSGIVIHPAAWRQQTWGAGSPSNTIWPGTRPILHTKWRHYPSSRLATTNMSRKLGLCVSPLCWVGELGPHLTHCGLGRGLPPCQVSS